MVFVLSGPCLSVFGLRQPSSTKPLARLHGGLPFATDQGRLVRLGVPHAFNDDSKTQSCSGASCVTAARLSAGQNGPGREGATRDRDRPAGERGLNRQT